MYLINDVFYSLQGEGVRAGTPNAFLRFAKCNMECSMEPGPRSPGGFDCDTEFESGRRVSIDEVDAWLRDVTPAGCRWVILTGGEPALQADRTFIDDMHARGWRLAIETNGSVELPDGLDWITVSPKVAEHAIRQRTADEVKYVRNYGQGIPKTVVDARHKLISPAFAGNDLDDQVLRWCVDLVEQHPDWRLTMQMHKVWVVR